METAIVLKHYNTIMTIMHNYCNKDSSLGFLQLIYANIHL